MDTHTFNEIQKQVSISTRIQCDDKSDIRRMVDVLSWRFNGFMSYGFANPIAERFGHTIVHSRISVPRHILTYSMTHWNVLTTDYKFKTSRL